MPRSSNAENAAREPDTRANYANTSELRDNIFTPDETSAPLIHPGAPRRENALLSLQRAVGNRATRLAIQAQPLDSKNVPVKPDAQSTKAPEEIPKKPAEASKAPAEVPKAPAAANQNVEKPASDAGPEKLSPLREELQKLFQLYEGKGIGDEEFEKICKKQWWEDRKKAEKEAKEHNENLPRLVAEWEEQVKADPNYEKTHPKPTRADESIFTTCIATQGKLLELAFKALKLHVKKPDEKTKYDILGYATMGRLEAKKRNAWVEAKPGISERPQKGDILVYEKRGLADKEQKKVDAENSKYGMFGQGEQKLLKEIAKMRKASEGANQAIAHAAAAKIPELEAKLAELRQKHEERLAELQGKLDEAREKTASTAGTEQETKGGRRGGLEFSHVGFFNGLKPELDATGKPTGREIWTTFDGGQFVEKKVSNEGSKSALRVYNPKTNEISRASQDATGTITQDQQTRWLGGWTNVDSLIDDDPYA